MLQVFKIDGHYVKMELLERVRVKGNTFICKMWEENKTYFYMKSIQGKEEVFLLRKKTIV